MQTNLTVRRPLFLMLALALSQVADCADAEEADSGATDFSLSLSAEGRLITCEIISSSGSTRNDDRVCEFLRTRARFQTRLYEGKPIASVLTSRMRFESADREAIEFRRNDQSAVSDRQVDTIVGTTKLLAINDVRFLKVQVLINPSGKVDDCAIIKSSGEDRVDNLVCDALRNNPVRPAVDSQNNPVRSVWDMKIMVRGFTPKSN